MNRKRARLLVLGCIADGINTRASIRDAANLSSDEISAALKALSQEGVLIARRSGGGYRYALTVRDPEPARTPPPRGSTDVERTAYERVRAAGPASAEDVALTTGLSKADALGALWRLVNVHGTLRVEEPDHGRAVFSVKR